MDITGTYTFNAPPDRVWALLMDPATIASCIPGCDRFEPDGEDRYKATLTIGLAAITGTYEGIVVITDKSPHNSYRLTVEGQGKPGFVDGALAAARGREAGSELHAQPGHLDACASGRREIDRVLERDPGIV